MSKWKRRGLIAAGAVAVAVPALSIAIHKVQWLGPALADGARAVLGPRAVAWAEDVSYGLQDRIDRWRYKDSAPTTFWAAPSGSAAALPPPASSAEAAADADPEPPKPANGEAFPPTNFNPPAPKVAAAGDGVWVAMTEGAPAGQGPVMYKAVVHPDATRSWAAVAIVAVDLRKVELHLVAGTQEPTSTKVPSERRPGRVPRGSRRALRGLQRRLQGDPRPLGHDDRGETFLAPRDMGCTVASTRTAPSRSTRGRDEGDRAHDAATARRRRAWSRTAR